jgi:hypothetical protein
MPITGRHALFALVSSCAACIYLFPLDGYGPPDGGSEGGLDARGLVDTGALDGGIEAGTSSCAIKGAECTGCCFNMYSRGDATGAFDDFYTTLWTDWACAAGICISACKEATEKHDATCMQEPKLGLRAV